MRVIQSYNTFGGEIPRAGFKTKRAMLDYLTETYAHHKQFDYMMFTDSYGMAILNGVIPPGSITVIDMPVIVRDRIPYVGKFLAHNLQTEPYIHVDIDAKLIELPTEKADVYCEKLEGRGIGYEAAELKINTGGVGLIPCSALIGFTDTAFKAEYLAEVWRLVELTKTIPALNYKHCWAIEEVMLAKMILDNKKTVLPLNCEHLHALK